MGKRAVLLISTMVAALAVASGVVLAANINCEPGTPCAGTLMADTMTGTSGVDNMDGQGGDDTMYGRGSGDTLSGGDGNDSIAGGVGNDSYVFSQNWGADNITSGEDSGEDTLDFSSILDSLDIDLLVSSTPRDEVFSRGGMLNFPAAVVIENATGGKARDVIRGNDVINHLSGEGGNDSLLGRGDNDRLFGGPGADALNGGPGNDQLIGSNAIDVFDNDVYTFQDGWGADDIAGDAAGTDHLFFGELPSTTSVTVDLAAGTANAGTNTVRWSPADANIENATGGAGIDTLSGNSSANTLNGQGGDDKISGEGGKDTISGDALGLTTLTGNDRINVRDEDFLDTVDCGPGTDTVFVDVTSVSDGTDLSDSYKNCERVNPPEEF